MVEIPLGRGCFALVSEDEIRKMLLQPANSQIYIEGVHRGKGRMRWRKMVERQNKAELNSIKKG